MASIYNYSSLAALQTLRSIDSDMERTQMHISTGLRVASAEDNASYWSIATTMRSDNAALSTVSDSLGLAAGKADTATAGVNATIDLLNQINEKLVLARDPNVDRDKVGREIAELKNQITSVAQSASFSGENWLYNSSTTALGTKSMVGGFIRTDASTVSVQTITFDASATCLLDKTNAQKGLLSKAIAVTQGNTTASFFLINPGTGTTGTEIKVSAATTDTQIEGMINATQKMISGLTDAGTALGALSTRLTSQANFVKTLQDVTERGIGKLVDADMNEESTKLKALQTRQQLGIQALAIANSKSQFILDLFR